MLTSDQHLQLSIVELTFFQLDKLPIKKNILMTLGLLLMTLSC